MKVGVSVLAMFIFLMVAMFPSMTLEHVDCIRDMSQEALQSHYDYFKENPQTKNYLLVASAALADVLLLKNLITWTLFGGSWRFVIALVLTYCLRQVFTSLFKLNFPENGDLW